MTAEEVVAGSARVSFGCSKAGRRRLACDTEDHVTRDTKAY
jgi:hypothetical protein